MGALPNGGADCNGLGWLVSATVVVGGSFSHFSHIPTCSVQGMFAPFIVVFYHSENCIFLQPHSTISLELEMWKQNLIAGGLALRVN